MTVGGRSATEGPLLFGAEKMGVWASAEGQNNETIRQP
jgi:hypothetical protein